MKEKIKTNYDSNVVFSVNKIFQEQDNRCFMCGNRFILHKDTSMLCKKCLVSFR